VEGMTRTMVRPRLLLGAVGAVAREVSADVMRGNRFHEGAARCPWPRLAWQTS
jgi:hypothetical protein